MVMMMMMMIIYYSFTSLLNSTVKEYEITKTGTKQTHTNKRQSEATLII
jgi:hypothetical protein